MFRKFRVVNFHELRYDVFGYISEFRDTANYDVIDEYFADNEVETDIANMIRDLIQSHECYSDTEKFIDGNIEFTVKASRDEFDSIVTEEDGTMTIGVGLEFDIYCDDVYDGFEDHARYDFKIEIKGVK